MAVSVMPCYVPENRASRGVQLKNLGRIYLRLRTGPLASGSDPLATGTARHALTLTTVESPAHMSLVSTRSSGGVIGRHESSIPLSCALSGHAKGTADIRPAVAMSEQNQDLVLDRALSGGQLGSQEAQPVTVGRLRQLRSGGWGRANHGQWLPVRRRRRRWWFHLQR